jgi:hypothetical protein
MQVEMFRLQMMDVYKFILVNMHNNWSNTKMNDAYKSYRKSWRSIVVSCGIEVVARHLTFTCYLITFVLIQIQFKCPMLVINDIGEGYADCLVLLNKLVIHAPFL